MCITTGTQNISLSTVGAEAIFCTKINATGDRHVYHAFMVSLCENYSLLDKSDIFTHMTSFLLSLAAYSVIGSINPNGFAVQIYLLSTPKPVKRALTFALGEYVGVASAGLLIAWGLIQVIHRLVDSLGQSIYVLQLLVGIALLVAGWNATKFFKPSKEIKPIQSLKPLHTFWLGFTIAFTETPTALPHIAAIEHMSRAHLSIFAFILIWALYNIVFVMPLLIMVGVYLILNEKAAKTLAKFHHRINVWFPRILQVILIGAGVFLIVKSLIHLSAISK